MNSLSNFERFALTKTQALAIKGGWACSCQCVGIGTWTGTYGSLVDVHEAISNYCENGGTCSCAQP